MFYLVATQKMRAQQRSQAGALEEAQVLALGFKLEQLVERAARDLHAESGVALFGNNRWVSVN